ncbi:MAG: Rpn family recombination-promoting nuclease/putative transposase, partial [Candidatus Competibacteraceae bacterium]|nr:Rpn family recombination-promoting nuclease/putative transposase [Candidatus Competibacteraceae bacterium]
WRVRFQDHWLYVYLLLEFQSSVDRFMAVRILSYTGLLYQDLIRSQSLNENRLPPVLPIVLYNGDTRWTAAVELAQLMEPAPTELKAYQPQQRYLLLDEGTYSDHQLAGLRNLVAAVFRLENSRTPDDVLAIVTALVDWLKQPQQTSLRRAFTVWIRRVILADTDTASEPMIELDEVRTMLAQRVQQWKQQWREGGYAEGLEQGREQGLEQGREQGLQSERVMLLRQSRVRFDTMTANALAPLLEQIHDPERLAQIGEWLIQLDSGEALLARVKGMLDAS